MNTAIKPILTQEHVINMTTAQFTKGCADVGKKTGGKLTIDSSPFSPGELRTVTWGGLVVRYHYEAPAQSLYLLVIKSPALVPASSIYRFLEGWFTRG